jgi:biotin transport system substrate-specific component
MLRTTEQGITLRSFALRVAIATFAAALVAAGARVTIPLWFTPVPITLQVFAVILIGLTLPWPVAFLALAEYVAAGLLGLPVFSGGNSGPAWLLGATGGYIYGFLVAAPVIALLSNWLGSYFKIVAALAGIGVIYFFGWIHLSAWYMVVQGAADPWVLGFLKGVAPFILVDVGKAVAATALVHGGEAISKRFL